MLHFLATLLAAVVASGTLAADWRQFRGTDVNGVAPEANPPETFAAETLAWTADLPGRGLSSPIVVGDRVYLTASSGTTQDRLHVLCFAAETGDKL